MNLQTKIFSKINRRKNRLEKKRRHHILRMEFAPIAIARRKQRQKEEAQKVIRMRREWVDKLQAKQKLSIWEKIKQSIKNLWTTYGKSLKQNI